jgi:transcriptional antiterminator RfaH
MNSTDGVTCWYVAQTHPRQEDRADMNLKAWGIVTLNPKIKEQEYSPLSGRTTSVIKPLFPRYIFVQCNATRLRQVQLTRGVRRVVCFGDSPSSIDDEIIAEIKSRAGVDGYIGVAEEFVPGDEVIVSNGPMTAFKGIFISNVGANDRVRILLETVSYQAHLEIEKAALKKINSTVTDRDTNSTSAARAAVSGRAISAPRIHFGNNL